MVQVLGRLALSFGIFVVAGLAGWLAQHLLLRDRVPARADRAADLGQRRAARSRSKPVERRPIDWRILGGGIAFGAFVLALACAGVPYNQEIVFVVSMAVVCACCGASSARSSTDAADDLLCRHHHLRLSAPCRSSARATRWFAIDVLGFDEAFQGMLAQIGAGLAFVGMWLFSDADHAPAGGAGAAVADGDRDACCRCRAFGLTLGLANWTEQMFGFGARTIAIIDTATTSPFAQLSMIPLLTLIAIYAPAGHRATWFALMASLMNLALVAGALQTKYLNEIFVVGRGDYANLPVHRRHLSHSRICAAAGGDIRLRATVAVAASMSW